jgi:hypothetical protein
VRPEHAAETGPASPTHPPNVDHCSTPDRLGRQSGPSRQPPTDDRSRWTCGHRARTEQLIAEAESAGRRRLVELNEPVRLSLMRIIDGLETREGGDGL